MEDFQDDVFGAFYNRRNREMFCELLAHDGWKYFSLKNLNELFKIKFEEHGVTEVSEYRPEEPIFDDPVQLGEVDPVQLGEIVNADEAGKDHVTRQSYATSESPDKVKPLLIEVVEDPQINKDVSTSKDKKKLPFSAKSSTTEATVLTG